ncbi:MAG: noncanonical pyrimidine nucleotidase, YjjG family [Clostridiales bacterium]|nr:noncanonical pyrimidine nucleotidase, YjjG family [Clostridiales bacterium]
MQRYSTVFFDADQTLFDFHAAEHLALCQVMKDYHLPVTEETIGFYVDTNRGLWKLFDQGGITQKELGIERFSRLLEHVGANRNQGAEMNAAYELALGQHGILLPGALELCRRLAPLCRLFILTNGMTRSQTGRLERSAIKEYIEKMYISQAIGCQKPMKAFFDYVFDDLQLTKEQLPSAVMVGDSLNSDIQGGIHAGIDTIWYHPSGNESPAPLTPTWEARSLEEIGRIILGE